MMVFCYLHLFLIQELIGKTYRTPNHLIYFLISRQRAMIGKDYAANTG